MTEEEEGSDTAKRAATAVMLDIHKSRRDLLFLCLVVLSIIIELLVGIVGLLFATMAESSWIHVIVIFVVGCRLPRLVVVVSSRHLEEAQNLEHVCAIKYNGNR